MLFEIVRKRYPTQLRCLSIKIGMSGIGYRIKLYSDIQYYVGLRALSPILDVPVSGSVRHGYVPT